MSSSSPRPLRRGEQVPVRTILATIGLVVATYISWLLIKRVAHILELIAVAAFFALALNPAVDFCERRLHIRRGFAVAVVTIGGVIALTGLLYLFVRPLIDQTQAFVDRFPQLVQDARNGKGTVGDLVQRYNVDRYVRDNQAKLREALTKSTSSVVSVAGAVASTIAALVTAVVLAIFMLLEGPRMIRVPLIFFDKSIQDRIGKVAADASKSVTGYMAGNLLISLVAGSVTFVTLAVLGVDFAVVLAVWVAFADLIPLVGATLGAIPSIGVAFLHSTKAGIITLIVYIVYQQVENHLLQTTIMARTVNLSPLTVLVSVLVGVELAGILGALVAIPVAGIIQVVGRDIFDHRKGRLKGEPTVGEEETPASDVERGSLDPKGA